MSHLVAKDAYKSLEARLNQFPQGAPTSDTLYKILNLLLSEKEAELMSKLPIRPFNSKRAAKAWKMNISEAERILEELASRAILLDMEVNGEQIFILPPPMAGFFEFSMMRTRQDIDQKLLGELFYQYLNTEEDFIKELFYSTDTKLGRIYVNESVLTTDNAVTILDYERASHIIKEAGSIALGDCYCRHKMYHAGEACDAPLDVCLTFGGTADSLIKHGYARRIDVSECMDVLERSYEHKLVQCGENVQNNPTFICNCCGCCCEALQAARKFGNLHPVETTNFIPKINQETCLKCGKCLRDCPIYAISKETDEHGTKTYHVDEDVCLGCGVCVRSCPNKSLLLVSRGQRIITPVNSVHRVVMMAIEKGQLQNLIFDQQAFASHRAMAAILQAI
ncbi:MAG TPA: (Fe-S)-binding protein, partial [Firmicutes bacterium]|nr:(Fe-S)-binding protein [Bacillota bacterium]